MIGLIYDILLLLPGALAASLLIKPFLADDVSFGLYVTVTIISFVFLLLMKHFKLRDRLIAVGVPVTFVAAMIFMQEEGTRLDWIKEHTWALSVASLTACISLLLMLARRNRLTRLIPAVIAVLYLPASLFWGTAPDRACVLFLFMFAIITCADEFQRSCKKEGDPSLEKHLVFISPFIIAVFIAASLIPVSSKPYRWGFVHKIYDHVQSGLSAANRFFNDVGWDSGSPFIGFSDNGRFGGNLTGGGYNVLDLTSTTVNDNYLYLAGRIYDTFDGREWSGDEPADMMYFDAAETASAAIDHTDDQKPVYNESLLDIIRPVTLETNKNSTGSDRVFAPSKTIPTPGSATRFDAGEKKVSYLRLNTTAPAFFELTKGGYVVTKKSWDKATELLGLADDAAYDFSDYEKYRSELKRLYLPETSVSNNVRAFMDDIVGDASTDYEKLTRIEEMLRGGRYTDTPGDLPETLKSGEDYLDYFLFEKREGYCSYYATAFVLLARSYGIPSRLVQGYKVPAGKNLHITVRSTDAHAWAESYIDGVGWVTFEPTPGMTAGPASSGWMTAEELAEYYRSHYSDQSGAVSDMPDDISDDGSLPETSISLTRIIVPVLCGLIFTALLLVADMLLKRRRYLSSSDREKALWMCQRSMHILAKHGYVRNASETLSEYRDRLTQSGKEADAGFLDTYENLLYSTQSVTNEEVVSLERSYYELKRSNRRLKLSSK